MAAAAWGALVRPRRLELRKVQRGASLSLLGFGSSSLLTPGLSSVYLQKSSTPAPASVLLLTCCWGTPLGALNSTPVPIECRTFIRSSKSSRTFCSSSNSNSNSNSSSSSSLIMQRATLCEMGGLGALSSSRMPHPKAAPLAAACKARSAVYLSQLESRHAELEGVLQQQLHQQQHYRLQEYQQQLQQHQQQQLQQQQQSVAADLRGRRMSRRNHQQQQQQQEEEVVKMQRLSAVQRAQQELSLALQRESAVLNLENIYLSWMRNALLATSCAMIAYSLDDWHTSISGAALLSIGGVCLVLGSVRVLSVLPRMAAHSKRMRHLQQQQHHHQQQHKHQQQLPGVEKHRGRRSSSSHPEDSRSAPPAAAAGDAAGDAAAASGAVGAAGAGAAAERGPRAIAQWFAYMAVPLQMLAIACIWILWLVAACGVAGGLPLEAK
ncbi:hypothetical protein ACSSS7_006775 [Eimeria intestinalis]